MGCVAIASLSISSPAAQVREADSTLDAELSALLEAHREAFRALPIRSAQGDDEARPASARPDGRAPAGVRYAELALYEGWSLEIRMSRNEQDGLRDKRDTISSSEIFAQGYSHAPRELTTDRIDFMLLYGMERDTTLFAGLPWISREMKIDTQSGSFDTETEGVGDLRLGIVTEYEFLDREVLNLTLGLSIPTGSIKEDDRDDNGQSMRLPYSMQLGTGTFDLLPGVTWMTHSDPWTLGLQGLGRIHLGDNGEGWARSNEGEVSAWAARSLTDATAASLRLRGVYWGDVHGRDDELDATRNPLEDRTRQGGERIDAIGGFHWQLGDGLQDVRSLGLEVGVPVAEWLDGPGISTRAWAVLAWRISF